MAVTDPNPTDGATLRVRFAPSPTGALHLGSAMVALANAALAQAHGGAMVLRIDDTDAVRSTDAATADVLRLLEWLGVSWDEGPIHQRERGDRYSAAVLQLQQSEDAYPCFCSEDRLAELRASQVAAGDPPRYDGRCRHLTRQERDAAIADGAPHTVRFSIPADVTQVPVDDELRGRITVPATAFGDPVLLRSDGSAGYLLATVVDDLDLRIDLVLRGEDHLTNTARQLLLATALLGMPPALRFAHLPLLRGQDGRKLSKRDPLGTLDELVDEGFEPSTIRRFLFELLGQGPVDLFDSAAHGQFELARVPKAGAPRVDRTRLESLGREDIGSRSLEHIAAATGIAIPSAAAPLVHELAAEAPTWHALRHELELVFEGPGAGDLPLLFTLVAPDAEQRGRWAAALHLAMRAFDDGAGPAQHLTAYRDAGTAAGFAVRELLQPLRVALTGSTSGPALDQVIAAIGTDAAAMRVQLAIEVLGH